MSVIIFCAADNINHDKYHDCNKTYYRIRRLCDELCKEHNLSIISPNGQREKKYNEWQADKRGGSDKTQLRKDINIAIKSASTYEEFLLFMRAKEYEIKGETFGENTRKRIRVHDIRHSHASLLINQGCDALILADRLGHEKVSITLNTYSHLFPHKQQELVSNLEHLAANFPNTTPPEQPNGNPLRDAAGITYNVRDYDVPTDTASLTAPGKIIPMPQRKVI